MIYMSIEQIRKEKDIYKRHLKDKVKNINDVDKLYKDIEYLLSIIDRYEKALKYLIEKETHEDEATEIARQDLKPNS